MALKKEFLIERNGKTFALYAGLLDLAHEEGLKAINTTLIQIPSDLNGYTAIVHAVVETSKGAFTGLGDADERNVSKMMLPHLIRMAETRAKARALRDAVNVGVASLEELGEDDAPPPRKQAPRVPPEIERDTEGMKQARAAVAKAPQKSPLDLYDALVARVLANGYDQAEDGELVAFTEDALPEHIRPEYDRLREWLKARQG